MEGKKINREEYLKAKNTVEIYEKQYRDLREQIIRALDNACVVDDELIIEDLEIGDDYRIQKVHFTGDTSYTYGTFIIEKAADNILEILGELQ